MQPPNRHTLFDSEAAWPFTLRTRELSDFLDFLTAETKAPRVLRIFGSSGSGKSFFARELLSRLAVTDPEGIGIYIDVPPADVEATTLFERVNTLISRERRSNREMPSFVSKKFASKWRSSQLWPRSRKIAYFHGLVRDIANLIPSIGPFLRLLFPSSLGSDVPNENAGIAAVRYIIKRSSSLPVVLALDNIQFLPSLVLEMLETELQAAGEHLRLIVIERVHRKPRIDWVPSIPGMVVRDVYFGPASLAEVTALVREALPEEREVDSLAGAIHRRSDGNLKSVWFQLKFVAERRDEQEQFDHDPVSYNSVIASLRPIDQFVLRLVVFLVGGLSIAHLTAICEASDLHIKADAVSSAITDLAALGLLIVNSDSRDRVRVEHELVSHVVNDLTPEGEKLELRSQLVATLSRMLDHGGQGADVSLYDRLVGIIHETDVRSSPALLSHLVKFIEIQNDQERFAHLSTMSRDTVCWDVLDLLPEHSVRVLLNSIQKCSVFNFGLILASKIKKDADRRSLACLYEAKYLVQLFRYEEARRALDDAELSKDRQAVAFNIMINLCQDDDAAQFALKVYESLSKTSSEQDFVVLRNSGHLFMPDRARQLVTAALEGFRRIGSRFGVATALNNLGIVEIFGERERTARARFEESRDILVSLTSNEVYQPLVNLSALCLRNGDLAGARRALRAAREALPGLLAMDAVMIDFNDAVLSLLAGELQHVDVVDMFRRFAVDANKTRDIRFAEIVSWFAACLEKHFEGRATTRFSTATIDRIRESPNAAMELFVPVNVNGGTLDAPYFLSPHWRY